MNNVSQPNNPATERDAAVLTAANKPTATGKAVPVAGPASDVTQPKSGSARQPSATQESLARDMENVVANLNDYAQSLQRDLRFSVDRDLNRPVVSVIDRETQEVIRQIPNEVALQLARNLKDQLAAEIPGAEVRTAGSFSLGLINTEI